MVKREIIQEKVKRIIENKEDAKIEFLIVVASHQGSVLSDSVLTSFRDLKTDMEKKNLKMLKMI